MDELGDVYQQIRKARRAEAEVEQARQQARYELEQKAEKEYARLRWAKQEILNQMQRDDPFAYSDGDLQSLDDVSDLQAELWLKAYDLRKQIEAEQQP